MTLENYRKIYIEYLRVKKLIPDDEHLTDEEIKAFVTSTIPPKDYNKYKKVLK